jgi:predicted nucleic acid-binding protein
MSRVYWDSMLFVYLLEGHPAFGPSTAAILREMVEREDTLCTSVFSIGEVLTGPRKNGFQSAADQAMRFFAGPTVEILPFSLETADQFSRVRASTGVSPPDAIHLATAAIASADVFFTNDKKLLQLHIPGIGYIAGLDRKIYSKYQP